MTNSKVNPSASAHWIRRIRDVIRGFGGYFTNDMLHMRYGATSKPAELESAPFTERDVIKWTQKALNTREFLRTVRARKSVLRSVGDMPHEVLPDLFVGSPEWVKLITLLQQRLSEAVPPSEHKDSIVDGRAVPGTWDSLLTAPSRPMQPAGYPAMRYSQELTSPVSSRHEQIMTAVTQKMFGTKWEPLSGYQLATKSSSSLPDMEYDVEWKLNMLDKAMRHFEDVLQLFRVGDFIKLVQEYGIMFVSVVIRRNQIDAVTIDEHGERTVKPRSAPSMSQILGRVKEEIFSGRRIADLPDFFRVRSRVAYAVNGPLNYCMSMFFQPLRDHYLNHYHWMFKHVGGEDLERKLEGWIPIKIDISQFDQGFYEFEANDMFDALPFRDDVKEMFKATWLMPVFSPSPLSDAPDQWAMFGDPFDPHTWLFNKGLISGAAYNPDFGKCRAVRILMCALDDIFHDTYENLENVMLGRHPAYGILNQGDDSLILVRTTELRDLVLKKLRSGSFSPYAKMTVEQYATFLGWVISQNGSSYKVHRNILSMVLNFLGNEHPIGHPLDELGHRRHWGLGVESWREIYGTCPEFETVFRILEETCFEVLGYSITSVAKESADLSRKVLGLSGLTLDEALLLEKPERRHYSIDMDRIRGSIADDIVRTVPPELIQAYCGPFIQLQSNKASIAGS